MAKAYVFLADGFETVEALAVVDILRRAGVDTVTVGVSQSREITSAQKVIVKADKMLADDGYTDGDIVFLPGGMPGTTNLEADKKVLDIVKKQYEAGKIVAAICAAPSILGHMNILQGKKATCYPGFEKDLYGAQVLAERVVEDGNMITSRGMGTAVDLGLALVKRVCGGEASDKIASGIQYR
ncbi:MAG: DJ-1/PfpI family protein [Alistipes sp.]|nr:DJ-1/PfpI family protein [Alistipes sp.]